MPGSTLLLGLLPVAILVIAVVVRPTPSASERYRLRSENGK